MYLPLQKVSVQLNGVQPLQVLGEAVKSAFLLQSHCCAQPCTERSWDRKVLVVDECGEHSHGRKDLDLILDCGAWQGEEELNFVCSFGGEGGTVSCGLQKCIISPCNWEQPLTVFLLK